MLPNTHMCTCEKALHHPCARRCTLVSCSKCRAYLDNIICCQTAISHVMALAAVGPSCLLLILQLQCSLDVISCKHTAMMKQSAAWHRFSLALATFSSNAGRCYSLSSPLIECMRGLGSAECKQCMSLSFFLPTHDHVNSVCSTDWGFAENKCLTSAA